MVLESPIRGFIAPVFAPFDATSKIKFEIIPKYAKYLANKNVKNILVNGTVGEGALMSVSERKAIAEAWVKESKTTGQKIMVHVGGIYQKAVIELAEHAESLGVAAILCLPDLTFKPKTKNELIPYLQAVSRAAPRTPLFYYHYPILTAVRLDMVELLEAAFHCVPTLAGLKFTNNNLEECSRCTQIHNGAFTVFLGCDQLIAPAMMLGIRNFIPTALNYAADQVFKLYECVEKGNNDEARKIQIRILNLAAFIEERLHWVNGFKAVITKITGIDLGSTRSPLLELNFDQKELLDKEIESGKFMA